MGRVAKFKSGNILAVLISPLQVPRASVHTANPGASLPKASALDSFLISFPLLENKKGRYRKVQIKRINSWAAAVIAEGRELEGLLHQVSPLQ